MKKYMFMYSFTEIIRLSLYSLQWLNFKNVLRFNSPKGHMNLPSLLPLKLNASLAKKD